MTLRMIKMAIMTLPALTLSEATRAETLSLSKVDGKIDRHIQANNTIKNGQCLAFVLNDFRERKIPKSRILITFDDPNIDGIGIALDETDEAYTCEAGELRSWEGSEFQVSKRF
jgi:hypothetical protein